HEIVVDDQGNVVDYRFLYVNKSFEKLTGFKEEDIINKTVLEVMPNTEKSWIAIYGDVAKTGKSIEYTDYSSALRKWFRVVAYSPKKNQFVTIFMDMTSEEELKQKLDYENQKFTKLVESSNDIIYELDMDMRYISVYGMLTKDESKDMQTIIGKTAEEIFTLGEAKIHIESNKKALNGEHCIYDWKTIDEKQKMSFYQTSLSPILDKDQKIIGAVGITRNISERVETEMELIHMKELMEYVIEHDRSAVAIHDKDLNYLYVSKDYLKQYRIEHKNVIGKHHYEVFTDIPQKWKDVHQRVLKGETISAEYDPFIRGDGTIDWTSWECRPWYEKDGQIGGMILYTEVINKRKKMEEDLFRIAYYD
ncbi:MAG: PAS domain-containing protein, partial [Acholeplasmataceae bacterium]|nr:PAS domain-containing protein [Acholeplasmataceae bacterium]